MSKSFKKFPIVIQEDIDRRRYRRVFRHRMKQSLRTGRPPRSISESWIIKYRWTLDEAIKDFEPSELFPTLESKIEYWKRLCLRK